VSISLFAVSLTPGFSPVDGRQAKPSRLTAWRAEKRLKPFWFRIGPGARLKPGVNENQCQLPTIEMLTSQPCIQFERANSLILCFSLHVIRISKQFEGVLDRYFETLLEDNPVFATYVGLRSGEGKLGRASFEFQARQERRRQIALRALENISPQTLSHEQQLDRLALRAMLLHQTEDFSRQRYALEPDAPEHLLNVLLHELQRAEDEPTRAARNLRSLMRYAPRFLQEAALLIKNPEPVWRNVMERTLSGAGSLLAAVRTLLLRHEPQTTDDGLIQATEKALNAYRAAVINRPLAPGGSFAIGAATMQRRVRDELGIDYTLGQIEKLALGEIERVGQLLGDACKRFGKARHANEIIEKLRSEWMPAKPLLELYYEETRSVANAFREARAVTFPTGDELLVRPVPDFMRSLFPTAAYRSPGAFEKRQRGIFWVNDLSLAKTSPSDKLAEQQQHFGLSLTCAHEAYPGHHLQFVTANRHPRKWRRLFAHAVFYEGWTLWCEQMMVDLKINRSPWLRLQQLHDALWRCHRILVDLRLQTGRYSYRQAVKHLQMNLGFTRNRAEGDANWYTASPAVPMSYWLGRLENERLHRRLVMGRGWTLQKFNDWLLSFGALPQAWIEKYGLD
jgi:uncharacterized protein (DUF885 family)